MERIQYDDDDVCPRLGFLFRQYNAGRVGERSAGHTMTFDMMTCTHTKSAGVHTSMVNLCLASAIRWACSIHWGRQGPGPNCAGTDRSPIP